MLEFQVYYSFTVTQGKKTRKETGNRRIQCQDQSEILEVVSGAHRRNNAREFVILKVTPLQPAATPAPEPSAATPAPEPSAASNPATASDAAASAETQETPETMETNHPGHRPRRRRGRPAKQ